MMLISLCIPCHNRLDDLKRTMPITIDSARASPPVEIVVVDYASPDALPEYLEEIRGELAGPGNPVLVSRRYEGRDHYHMAHARNLTVRLASGDYIVILSADIAPRPEYLNCIRHEISANGYAWIYVRQYRGVVCCKRQEIIDAGAYDEDFEFYGPEDRDLHERLLRRGERVGSVPPELIYVIQTPKAQKALNYRLPLTRHEMHNRGMAVLRRNIGNGALVANEGREWGRWA